MAEDMKITVGIPVYNVERYIERALLSVLNQSYDNLEIIVVDDRGGDASMDIVREICATHPRGKDIRIIQHDKNLGIGATRNTVIDNAEGEYIMFMDSDDYITDDCVNKLYTKAKETGSDMVVGSFDEFTMTGGDGRVFRQINGSRKGPDVLYEWFVSPTIYVQTWNKLYKTELLRKNAVRCIPSNRNEDVLFTFQLLKPVTSVVFISDITYHYQTMNPNSVTYNMATGVFDEKEHVQYIGILSEMLRYMQKHNWLRDKFLNEYFLWFYRIRNMSVISDKGLSSAEKVRYVKELRQIPVKNINLPGLIDGVKNYGRCWLYSALPARLSVLIYNWRIKLK